MSKDSTDVIEQLVKISPSRFEPVGYFLGLSSKQLEICRLNNSHDEMVTDMVDFLMRKRNAQLFGELSWKLITAAVAAPYGGSDCSLAKDIARRYPKG